jgi:hypothetical protein
MRVRWLVAVVVAGLSMSGLAWADVVGPPEENCLPGTMGATSHSGPYCAPAVCSTEYEPNRCTSDETCESRRLCVLERACGGMQMPDAAPCTLATVTTECSSSGSCAEGSCQTLRVCMPIAGTGGASASGGSSSTGGAAADSTGGNGPTSGTGGANASDERDLSQDSGCGCRMGATQEHEWLGLVFMASWLRARRARARRRGAR